MPHGGDYTFCPACGTTREVGKPIDKVGEAASGAITAVADGIAQMAELGYGKRIKQLVDEVERLEALVHILTQIVEDEDETGYYAREYARLKATGGERNG